MLFERGSIFHRYPKKQRTDVQMRPLGGVTYISTCTAVNLHPIVKPFEMVALWGVIDRSIFCLTIGWLKVEILAIFKKFRKILTVGAAEYSISVGISFS